MPSGVTDRLPIVLPLTVIFAAILVLRISYGCLQMRPRR